MKLLKKKYLLIFSLVFVIACVQSHEATVFSSGTRGVISIAFDDNYQNQFDYAFPLMSARGIVGTFYVVTDHVRGLSTADTNYMNIANLQMLQSNGNEIGSHSKTHSLLPGLTEQQIRDECSISQQVLQTNGFVINNFAYPDGPTNDTVDSIVSQYYRSGRTAHVGPYLMTFPTTQFRLPAFNMEESSTELTQLKGIVDQVYDTNGWAVVFFHNIRPGDNTSPYTTSSEVFGSFLDYTISKGVQTLTVNQALSFTSPTPSPTPTPTASPTPSPTPTPTAASKPTPTPTLTPTQSPTPTTPPTPTPPPSPSPTATPEATPSPTIMPSPTSPPIPTATPNPSPSSTPNPTNTPTPTTTPTITPPIPTATPNPSPSSTPNPTNTPTPITTPTITPFQFNITVEHKTYTITANSNSTVSELNFNPAAKELSFKVSEQSGTTGFCTISIPGDLIWGQLSVYENGSLLVSGLDYIQSNNGTHNIFQINYNHSVHDFKIIGAEAVPELSSFIVTAILVAAVSAGVIAYKRKLNVYRDS